MGWGLNVGMIASPPGDLDVCVCGQMGIFFFTPLTETPSLIVFFLQFPAFPGQSKLRNCG